MTYEQLVENVKKATKHIEVSKTIGHIAFQFNIVGDPEGIFYLEIDEGKINVEPYEYHDRDITIVTTMEIMMLMLIGELQPMAAYTNEQIKVYGDVSLLMMLPFGSMSKAALNRAYMRTI